MSERVFIDTDIALDLLAKRLPWYEPAAQLFDLIESGRVQGFVSPVIIANLFYILRKSIGAERAIAAIRRFRLLVGIAPLGEEVMDMVLASDFTDLEDAIQFYAAKRQGIEIILTRNTRHFAGRGLSIMNCDEFLRSRG